MSSGPPTDPINRAPEVPSRKPDSSVIPMIRGVRSVWLFGVMLTGLVAAAGVIGKGYVKQLEGVDSRDVIQHEQFKEYQKTQNGHLHQIDIRLTGIEWEQRLYRERIESEQKVIRATLERIERKVQ